LAIDVWKISTLDSKMMEISTLDTEQKWRFKRRPLILLEISPLDTEMVEMSTPDTKQSGDLSVGHRCT
jgi:hypothetical protein